MVVFVVICILIFIFIYGLVDAVLALGQVLVVCRRRNPWVGCRGVSCVCETECVF